MSQPDRSTLPRELESPARWALTQMLEAAFDDRESMRRCLDAALRSAGRTTLPESIDDVLAFARAHLQPLLAEELGPRTVQMLLDDLCTELSRMRRSSVRMARVALRRIASPVEPLTLGPVSEAHPTIRSPEPDETLPSERPLVAIADGDRWARAPIARALLKAGFDVLPLEGPTDLLDVCARGDLQGRFDALIIDPDAPDADAAIAALHTLRPSVRVLSRALSVDELVETIAAELAR
ncbi:MAG: hypothetical protein HYV09_18385 [Deltaproteobacteria bacterium]|nr:hypothetical protein [Deltaproteobacteria bacterium]